VESLIDDSGILLRIYILSYYTTDPTGNWVGGGRPKTLRADKLEPTTSITMKDLAKWSAIHYSYYQALIDLDPLHPSARKTKTALDFGCAGGARTAQLGTHYSTATGIDRDAECCQFANQFNKSENVKFIHGDLRSITEKYDRIFCVETLEHFYRKEQLSLLMFAIDHLNAGGLFLMTMPNEPPQIPPHVGTMLDDEFDKMMKDTGANILQRGHFDSGAPGDPCADGWSPYGPKHSHHIAVLEKR